MHQLMQTGEILVENLTRPSRQDDLGNILAVVMVSNGLKLGTFT